MYCIRCHKLHDDVIKWKHFLRYWPFVRGIHRSPVNSPHKGQWRGALMFSLICVWINSWVNNNEAGDLRHYPAHYDITVMYMQCSWCNIGNIITSTCVTKNIATHFHPTFSSISSSVCENVCCWDHTENWYHFAELVATQVLPVKTNLASWQPLIF